MKKDVRNVTDADILNVDMPIYTKTGDGGITSLFGGIRVLKSDLQIEAYGSVDELSSYLGLIIAKINCTDDKRLLTEIQTDLYQIMAVLAGKNDGLSVLKNRTKQFEQKIDELTLRLPKLNRFILPQGSEISTFFHIARTICRRAEREAVRYFEEMKIENRKPEITQYLNRLSDLLFMMARGYNSEKEVAAK